MSLARFGGGRRRLSLEVGHGRELGISRKERVGGLSHLGRGRLYLEVGWVG